MLMIPPRYENKHCFIYCGPERCNCINGNRDKIPNCPACNGTGRADGANLSFDPGDPCDTCKGSGLDGY